MKNLQCELCEFELNIKKLFQEHTASLCLNIIMCDLGCGLTFEAEDQVNEQKDYTYLKMACWNCKTKSLTKNSDYYEFLS